MSAFALYKGSTNGAILEGGLGCVIEGVSEQGIGQQSDIGGVEGAMSLTKSVIE